MKDVAERAGVSVKTVSRVVNGESGVTEKLENRVRLAVDDLGYLPDERARSLKSGRQETRTVGLVTVDVSNPFHSELNRSLEDAATDRGFLLVAGSSDESPGRERALVEEFVRRRVDGLLVVPSGPSQEHLEKEVDRGTPMVFIDRVPAGLECDYVATDNVEGARAAVRVMLRNGHERIAFIGDDPVIWTALQRLVGYERELGDAGLDIDPNLVVTGVRGREEAERAVHELLAGDPSPTAIFSAQNLITLGVVRAIHELGLARDVAVVGFDDLEFAELVTPGVTVIAQDPRRMGVLAAERLFARMDGESTPPRGMLLSPSLIQRGSGEIPA